MARAPSGRSPPGVPDDAETDARFQVLVGLRSIDEYMHFLDGKGRSLLGDVATAAGEALAYDALVDRELALEHRPPRRPGLAAECVRPLPSSRPTPPSSSTIRHPQGLPPARGRAPTPMPRCPDGSREVGFQQIARALAEWRRGDHDLAVLRRFLPGGTDGCVLALTSLRDL